MENAAQGKITGSAYGVAFSGNADFAWVDNAGDIYGKTAGVHVSTLGDGGSIENSGTIRSEGDGIDVSLKPGKNTYIENVGGTIRGGVNAVHSEGGNVELHNYGLIDGRILLAAPGEADFVENTGQILGRVLLGGGSDFFDGAGVSSGALSGGTSGAVFGEGGSDRLIGGGHRDKLHGGAGFNTLTGGAGHDQFFFDTALNRSFDHITDFVPGADKIMLSHAIFHGVNAPGHVLSAAMLHVGPGFTTAGQRIDYNPGNGWLIYDSNGSAAGGAHAHFATLDPHLHLHSTDFMVIA